MSQESDSPPTKKYTDAEIELYRKMVINFMNSNKGEIKKIYMSHFEKDGLGLLVISLLESSTTQKTQSNTKFNVDVMYVKNKAVPSELMCKINECKSQSKAANTADDNTIYILMCTPAEEQIVELNLNTLAT